MDPYHPGGRTVAKRDHPFPIENVVAFDTMYVETGHFLRQMLRDISIAGGKIQVRDFPDPQAIQALPESLVFNCTGLGARALFGDEELHPVRGQLAVLLPQPDVRYAFAGSSGYMFPRADGILLGGTFEHDQWDDRPQQSDIARIIESHKEFFEGFRCAD
jgi:hypothetical protein